MKNLLVAQSGGPTSAINATLAGVIENALSSPSVDKIYGSVNGIQGVLNENLIDLKIKITNVSELDLLCQTPASALGSCRVKLKDPAVCADEYETIISVLRKYSIDCFIYIVDAFWIIPCYSMNDPFSCFVSHGFILSVFCCLKYTTH